MFFSKTSSSAGLRPLRPLRPPALRRLVSLPGDGVRVSLRSVDFGSWAHQGVEPATSKILKVLKSTVSSPVSSGEELTYEGSVIHQDGLASPGPGES